MKSFAFWPLIWYEKMAMRCALACLSLLVALSAAAERGVPPTEGIHNFGKINDSLYRGAQPDAAAIQSLARLGIKSIINLRLANDVWTPEAAAASASGITYTNVPLNGTGRPSDAQVAALLALIESLPAPVFIHCKHGCDRTGTIVACYRISRHGWSNNAALQEAWKYGLSIWERGMIRFIREFGRAPTKRARPFLLTDSPRPPN